MEYVYLGLNWTFGALLLLTGLVLLVEDSILAGLSLISISTLLLPPVRNWVHSKTGKEISTKARAASIFVLLIAYSLFVVQEKIEEAKEREAQRFKQLTEQAAAERQKIIDYYNANSPQILADIRSALSSGEYQKAVSLSSKYLDANNSELSALYAAAKEKIAEAQRAEESAEILTELKTVPSSDAEKNKSLYQHLVKLNPDNQEYQAKVKLYTDKIAEEQERIRQEQERIRIVEARKKKIESQFRWDGSHRVLERVIKELMNNPKSYEHIETVYWDKGDYLIVRTTFRGTNAFGGVIKDSIRAKVSIDGQVLKIMDK